MRKLLALAFNDFLIRFRRRLDLVFFLVLPVVFTAIVGVGLRNLDQRQGRFTVAVVDADGGTLSTDLHSALEASAMMQVKSTSAAEAQALMDKEDIQAVITIPAGFTHDVLEGKAVELSIRTISDRRALAIKQLLSTSIERARSPVAIARASLAEAEKIRPFDAPTDRQVYFDEAIKLARQSLQGPAVTITTNQSKPAGPSMASGFAQSSPGQLITWVLITFIGGAVVLVNKRVIGTLQRLVVMPISRATILGGRILGRYSMGLMQMVILIVFGWAVFGVAWGRDPVALVLMALAFALSATTLGLMVSTFARTPSQASSATIALSMLLSTLGGAWWPLEVTPPAYQAAVKIFPTTWAMKGFTDIIVRGQGVVDVLPKVGMLLLFATVFFAIGIWRFTYE